MDQFFLFSHNRITKRNKAKYLVYNYTLGLHLTNDTNNVSQKTSVNKYRELENGVPHCPGFSGPGQSETPYKCMLTSFHLTMLTGARWNDLYTFECSTLFHFAPSTLPRLCEVSPDMHHCHVGQYSLAMVSCINQV